MKCCYCGWSLAFRESFGVHGDHGSLLWCADGCADRDVLYGALVRTFTHQNDKEHARIAARIQRRTTWDMRPPHWEKRMS